MPEPRHKLCSNIGQHNEEAPIRRGKSKDMYTTVSCNSDSRGIPAPLFQNNYTYAACQRRFRTTVYVHLFRADIDDILYGYPSYTVNIQKSQLDQRGTRKSRPITRELRQNDETAPTSFTQPGMHHPTIVR
jgi:hypothetical protein